MGGGLFLGGDKASVEGVAVGVVFSMERHSHWDMSEVCVEGRSGSSPSSSLDDQSDEPESSLSVT